MLTWYKCLLLWLSCFCLGFPACWSAPLSWRCVHRLCRIVQISAGVSWRCWSCHATTAWVICMCADIVLGISGLVSPVGSAVRYMSLVCHVQEVGKFSKSAWTTFVSRKTCVWEAWMYGDLNLKIGYPLLHMNWETRRAGSWVDCSWRNCIFLG